MRHLRVTRSWSDSFFGCQWRGGSTCHMRQCSEKEEKNCVASSRLAAFGAERWGRQLSGTRRDVASLLDRNVGWAPGTSWAEKYGVSKVSYVCVVVPGGLWISNYEPQLAPDLLAGKNKAEGARKSGIDDGDD
jgi:hypothetical protein